MMPETRAAIDLLREEHGEVEVVDIHQLIPTVPDGLLGVRKGAVTWVIDIRGRIFAGSSFAATLVQERRGEWECRSCGHVNPAASGMCDRCDPVNAQTKEQ